VTIPNYRDAFAQFLVAQKEAVKFTNSNFTNSAITRERYRRLQEARETLRVSAAGHAVTLGTIDPEAALAEAFDGILARDADSVAVANNEWTKVRAMLDSGRELGQIIDNADRRRLSAVLDRIEELGTASGDPKGVTAEVQARVLDRLAALGDEKATAAVTARESAQHSAAWSKVIEEALAGPVSVGTRSALFNASPDDFRATIGQDEWPEVDEAVQQLDRIAPNLTPESA
jgi:hypothetical protein